MMIIPEYLAEFRQQIEAQRQQLLAEFHRATGALTAVDALIERLKQPEPDASGDPLVKRPGVDIDGAGK